MSTGKLRYPCSRTSTRRAMVQYSPGGTGNGLNRVGCVGRKNWMESLESIRLNGGYCAYLGTV